jgi:hypothetical protein
MRRQTVPQCLCTRQSAMILVLALVGAIAIVLLVADGT